MKLKYLCFGALVFGLTACGFHIPNQTRLGNSMSEIYISGDARNTFYKLVAQKLEVRGVKVTNRNKLRPYQIKKDIPTLNLNSVRVMLPIVSVNAVGVDLEYGVTAISSAVLKVPNHTHPIFMNNLVTRTTFNKADNTLASNNESDILVQECYDILSTQMVDRINYLGKMSDPDEPMANPAELVLARDEDGNEIFIDNSPSMTLLDALRSQREIEDASGKSVSLSELNNGMTVLNPNKTHELPKVAPKLINEAPETVSEEGFLKN